MFWYERRGYKPYSEGGSRQVGYASSFKIVFIG